MGQLLYILTFCFNNFVWKYKIENQKKKKKADHYFLIIFQNFGSVGKRQTNIFFFFRPNDHCLSNPRSSYFWITFFTEGVRILIREAQISITCTWVLPIFIITCLAFAKVASWNVGTHCIDITDAQTAFIYVYRRRNWS